MGSLKILGGVVGTASVVALVTTVVTLDQRVRMLEREVQELSVVAVGPESGVTSRSRGRRGVRAARGVNAEALQPRPPMRPRLRAADAELDGLTQPEMRDEVRALVREERAREAQERQDQFRTMFTERIDSRMEEFARDFGVSDEHRDELAGLLLAEVERSFELRDQARAGERTRAEVREAIQATRAETSTRAGELLTEDQLEAFEGVHQRRGRGRWGGGPQGGPPPM